MCNEELKIHQKKEERQRVFTCLYGQNIDRMEERKATIYGKKKNGEKKSQNKRNMKGWKNCMIKVWSSGKIKS